MTDQRHSSRQRLGAEQVKVDAELDRADHEPSLGATETHPTAPARIVIGHKGPGTSATQYSDTYANQEHWALSGRDDREHEDDNGLGDLDGMAEQIGTAWGGMLWKEPKEQPWRRRHAVQLACQLPEYQEDALLVLRLAEQLVTGFLFEAEQDVDTWPIMSVVHRLEPRDRV
ncbi:hypothetical protein [Bradyrhizobium sp. 27S5]|uniref:hypothetical protein n=1 Tax=Bradyrhizobium sp. 27S5 TaxID=3139728 RepID=UPI0030CA7F77